jgi:hypothetical protein
MNKHKRNESGFSVVELLLIVVVIAVLGAASWLFYTHRKKTSTATPVATTTKSTTTTVTKAPVDPTAAWTAYSDTTGKFSLRYPTTWVKAEHPELCSPGILLLGPTANTVGHCASEDFGEVSIVSSDNDTRASYEMAAGYTSIVSTAVTVDGVVGKKVSAVAKDQANQDAFALGALDDGTIVVRYTFFTNGKTYAATYTQKAGNPDVLSDFNLLVTKTLTFK